MSKAPDKIYVREFDAGLSQIWSGIKATETSAIMQHEYIRKDALLEWLEGYNHPITKLVMKDIINKIESL